MMIDPFVAWYGLGPIFFAGFRIDRRHGIRPHQDQLPLAARFNNRWWRIALLWRRQVVPDLLAGVLVECDRMRAVAAGHADQLVAVDERVARITPQRRLRVVLLAADSSATRRRPIA